MVSALTRKHITHSIMVFFCELCLQLGSWRSGLQMITPVKHFGSTVVLVCCFKICSVQQINKQITLPKIKKKKVLSEALHLQVHLQFQVKICSEHVKKAPKLCKCAFMVVYNVIIIFIQSLLETHLKRAPLHREMLLLTCLIKVYLWIDVYNGLKHASEK